MLLTSIFGFGAFSYVSAIGNAYFFNIFDMLTFTVNPQMAPFVDYYFFVLQFFFKKWELYAASWEAFYSIDILALYWLTLFCIFLYTIIILYITRVYFLVVAHQLDPWTLFGRLFYSIDFVRHLPEVDALSQTFGPNFRSAKKIAPLLYADASVAGNNEAQFMRDYNLSVGFGGYVGFIDFFPSHDATFSLTALHKNRTHLHKSELTSFWQFFYALKLPSQKKILDLTELWRKTNYRFNYFGADQTTNRASTVKPNLASIPRFKRPFIKNRLWRFLALLIKPVSDFGDLQIMYIRELFYNYSTLAETDYAETDPNQYVRGLKTAAPLGIWTMGSFVDLYQRELSAVILARTTQRVFEKKTQSLFAFGRHSLINDYTFWRTGADFESKFPGAFENTSPVVDELEDDAGTFTAQIFESIDEDEFSQEGEAPPWELLEHQEEEYERTDELCFEDGSLHEDIEPAIFWEEEEVEEDYDEVFAAGAALDGYSSDDEDDFVILELLGHDQLRYGAGQEEDYLFASLQNQKGEHRDDYLDSNYVEAQGIFSTFYEDVSDFFWLTSRDSGYKNFLEYPDSRFLNKQLLTLSVKQRTPLVNRFDSGRLATFFTPFLFQFLTFTFWRPRAEMLLLFPVLIALFNYFILLAALIVFFDTTLVPSFETILTWFILGWGLFSFLLGLLLTYFSRAAVMVVILRAFVRKFWLFPLLLVYVYKLTGADRGILRSSAAKLPAGSHPRRYSLEHKHLVFALEIVSNVNFRTISAYGSRFFFVNSYVQSTQFWSLKSRDTLLGIPGFVTFRPFSNFFKPKTYVARNNLASVPCNLSLLGVMNEFQPKLVDAQFQQKELFRAYTPQYLFSSGLTIFEPRTFNVFQTFLTLPKGHKLILTDGLSLQNSFTSHYGLTSFTSTLFEDFWRIKLKKTLIISSENLGTIHTKKNSLNSVFLDATFFYTALEKKLFTPNSQHTVKSNPPFTKSVSRSQATLDSTIFRNNLRDLSENVNIRSNRFEFFSVQLFGENTALGTSSFLNFARLLFSDSLISKIYAARFAKATRDPTVSSFVKAKALLHPLEERSENKTTFIEPYL